MTDNPSTTHSDDATISFEVRPQCSKCDRLATVFDRDETPFCARHATIFMYGRDAAKKDS